MTSTITLYKDSKIIPSRNFVVEGIETYLAGLTKTTISNFQYLRNDLNLTIKINLSQVYTDSNTLYNYNYLKVVQNSITYYYFVIKKTQVAENTIAFELVMDTLNTYPWNTAFTPSNRTRVKREHKDRFVKGSPAQIDLLVENIDESTLVLNTLFYEIKVYDRVSEEEIVVKITSDITISFGEEGVVSIILDSPELVSYFEECSNYITFIVKPLSAGDTPVSFEVVIRERTYPKYNYRRLIDYYSEGITPVLYKEELGELLETNPFQWSLVYRNADNDENAVSCYCIPSDEVSLYIPSKTDYVYTDFEDGKYYLIGAFWRNWTWRQTATGYILVDGEKITHSVSAPGASATFDTIVIHRSGSTLSYAKYRFIASLDLISGGLPKITSRSILSGSFKTFTTMSLINDKLVSKVNSVPNVNESYPYYNDSFTLTEATYTLTSFPNIDRVDPKLIKIIKLPYFPSYYKYESGKLNVDETFVYESSVYNSLLLNDLDTKFLNSITSNLENPLNVFDLVMTPSTSDLRNDNNESKLFHSDYYQPKFVYDSFGFVFELEKIKLDEFKASKNFSFEFIMTSTINSKFMFKFPEYILKMSTSDYDNILPVARNNEAPIYNSAYITYLRTAYRYDLKQYYQNEGVIKFNTAMGVGRSVVQFALSSTEKNMASKVSGILSSFGSYATSMFNGITELNENEWNFQKKIDLLKSQANSVSGSDDLDLLENYASNHAKLCLYKVSPRMKDLLADIFYYFGYTTDEIKIPSIDTRYWFNFLACEIEFTGLDNNITDLCKENLIARYNAGATFLHNHAGVWDFAQEKENWETSIL